LIRAENISKVDGDRFVLNNISLQVDKGEKIAILGDSGSDNTTLLDILAGLEPYCSGSLSIDGNLINPNSKLDSTTQIRQNSIGFLFRELHLIPFNTVYENIAVPLLLKSYSLEKARPLIESVMDDLCISELKNAMPTSLSDDEKQRVALARAVVHSPNIIFADDPTGDLNVGEEDRILALLDAAVSDRQCVLVLVTQSTKATALCTTQYTLKNGCLAVR